MMSMKGRGKGLWGEERSGAGAAAGARPGDWTCPSCGNLNFSYKDKCNKCGEPRGGAKRMGMRPGDWLCPACGDLVFASKSACKMCGTPKPDNADTGGHLAMGKGYSPY